ncbi:response regulator, partial [bacterium]|nr:response regulator [bacterium]
FRTPMNSIIGFAQLLADEESLSRKQKDFVEKILISGDHLKELIDDILDLAKIEAGAVEINLVTIDLCTTMDELIATMEPLAKECEVEVSVRESDTHFLVKADPLRFHQVILNIVSNAIKYNCSGGRVELYCSKIDEKWLRLNIVDDGPGIAPDRRPFLFEPFNRLGAEASGVQGSGIGLVISKNLSELMGCRLGLLEKDDPGCHFYVDLPLVDQASADAANPPVQESKTNFSSAVAERVGSCTLLYIEDNELNRMLLASIIEKRPSVTLLSAVDGRQGIEVALKELPDLILADIGLPDIDGFAVLAELQKHAATRKIPVVALSGNASKDDIKKAYAVGFVGYLTKPINVGHLFETIDEILANA